MGNAVVIVAAGRGERIGGAGGPKQYRELAGRAVLQHTIDRFAGHPDIDLVQVVIHPDDTELYDNAVEKHPKLLPPVIGGATRQASCKAGVDALSGHAPDAVLIHDAARPFVTHSVISDTVNGASPGVCALPAIAISDTVKRRGSDGLLETVPRDGLFTAQTPQGFLWSEIREAHGKAAEISDQEFTDDAAVAEWFGMQVNLVGGEPGNFKITTLHDLEAAEEKVAMNSGYADVRSGVGYDVHTLGPGDGVILCGVRVSHDQALQGHSDADVGLHALTDALLGTIGAGDIGSHFPPSEPKWKDAQSDQFLAHAVKLVAEAGGKITNLDVALVCEAPKIGPHRDIMRSRIADICSVDLFRVSVKATTHEGIGSIGRGEGIAALATASVSFRG